MKRTPGQTTAEGEKYWLAIIEEARRYPAGVAAYCRDKRVNKNSYYFWFKRLKPNQSEWTDLNEDNLHRARRHQTARQKSVSRKTEVEMNSKAKRRRFSAAEKARILQEVDQSSGK